MVPSRLPAEIRHCVPTRVASAHTVSVTVRTISSRRCDRKRLTRASDGRYASAMRSDDDMQSLVDELHYFSDQAANMDCRHRRARVRSASLTRRAAPSGPLRSRSARPAWTSFAGARPRTPSHRCCRPAMVAMHSRRPIALARSGRSRTCVSRFTTGTSTPGSRPRTSTRCAVPTSRLPTRSGSAS
jgi:hypothetical protein